jgi:hypothetical protein
LAEKKIKPETHIKITQQTPQQVFLQVDGEKQVLDCGLAACVFVKKAGRKL